MNTDSDLRLFVVTLTDDVRLYRVRILASSSLEARYRAALQVQRALPAPVPFLDVLTAEEAS